MESKVLFNHRLKGNGHNLVTNVGYIHVQQSSKIMEFDWWLMEFSRLHKDKTVVVHISTCTWILKFNGH